MLYPQITRFFSLFFWGNRKFANLHFFDKETHFIMKFQSSLNQELHPGLTFW